MKTIAVGLALGLSTSPALSADRNQLDVLAEELDCAHSHFDMVEQILGFKWLEAQPFDGGIGYSGSPTDTSLFTFTVTNERHPAHPAIARQRLVQEDGLLKFSVSGCGEGDKAAFDTYMKNWEGQVDVFDRHTRGPGGAEAKQ
ncbi:hypothetical protein [Pyruvatibacter mobilis]|uniref:hypothetical protein n=1 Tax=Pyruvatibacter mobilis TaxID=1712261 RepID=UPI00040CFD59